MFGKMARSLVRWVAQHVDARDRQWADAWLAEIQAIDGGVAQFLWAVGALRLLWRPFGPEVVRFLVCIAAVVVSNYAYAKFATEHPIGVFFYAQQLYLPVIGIFAARAIRQPWAGTLAGIAASLLAFAALFGLASQNASAASLIAYGTSAVAVQILFFAVVGAAFGTAGNVVNSFGEYATVAAPRPSHSF